ncbi:MAG: hypothetical protein M3Y06_04120, partial [Actinomycetota bacterium]|nr:hypothetical protein [Actinomycetota bacterium]
LLPFITGGPDTHRHQTEGPNTLVSVQSSAIAYTAEVTVVEPASRTPSDRIALRLAHDPRLTATT